MTNYIFKRILLGFISLFLLIVVVFFLLELIGTSPIDPTKYKSAKEYDEALKVAGLNDPLIIRFFHYITGLFKGDFGHVYDPQKAGSNDISKIFFGPLKYSIIVTSIAFVIGTILGIGLGFWAGYKSGKLTDVIINFVVVLFIAVPSFILAAFLIVIGPKIGLPSNFLDWSVYGWSRALMSMILPILILVVTSLASLTYYIRNEIKTILVSDFVTNARSKGLSEWNIFRKYVVRNAAIPLVTIVIPSFVTLLAGSLIVEQFFGIPGTSTVIVNAVKTKETNIVLFNIIFFGFLGMMSRILVDVLYVVIDPRIKYSSATTTKNRGVIARIKRYKTARMRRGENV